MHNTTAACPICYEPFPVRYTFGDWQPVTVDGRDGFAFPASVRAADLQAGWLEHLLNCDEVPDA